jgi:hypothetical protein
MPINDIYSIRCGRCSAHMGVCPSPQPMPSIYCVDCEDSVRAEIAGEGGATMSDEC